MIEDGQCDRCKSRFTSKGVEVNLVKLPSGKYRCLNCFYAGVVSFNKFIDHWINYKIETAEGKEYNMRIKKDVERQIEETRRKILMRDGR